MNNYISAHRKLDSKVSVGLNPNLWADQQQPPR